MVKTQYEEEARKKGFNRIAGVDEAGRGPLAGPVVAAGVILPETVDIDGIDDSKKLTDKKRRELFSQIYQFALSVGIGFVDHATIDEINILQATHLAMKRAISSLSPAPDYLLIDALTLSDQPIPQQGIIKGDTKSISIGAASILAKVARDLYMERMCPKYPKYNFSRHKGYGTKAHIEAIRTHGLSPIHRQSFRPKQLESTYQQLSLFKNR
jgi:ribonuclease HII